MKKFSIVFCVLMAIGFVAEQTEEKDSQSIAGSSTVSNSNESFHDEQAKLDSWYNSGGEEQIDALSEYQGDISDAASDQDLAMLTLSCSALRDAVDEAKTNRIPVEAAQTIWYNALLHYREAASLCIRGVKNVDSDIITESANETQLGNLYMEELTDYLRSR